MTQLGTLKISQEKDMEKTFDWIRFYSHYGIDFVKKSGTNPGCECFHCGEEKLFIEPQTGVYVCKLCGHSGNNITFIRQLHDKHKYVKGMPVNLIKKLAKAKNIPASTLVRFGVVEFDNKVWLPVYNRKDKLIGLRNYNFNENKIFNPPGFCEPNFWSVLDPSYPYYIFEADFDALAFLRMRDIAQQQINVVALPGINLKNDWVKYFKGKKTIWAFDYDSLKGKEPNQFYPGEQGVEKIHEKMDGCTANFKWVDWDQGEFTRPFDIRDLSTSIIAQGGDKVGQAEAFFERLSPLVQNFSSSPEESDEEEVLPAIPITNFEDLVKEFDKHIHVTPTFEKCLCCACAAVISAKTADMNALWMFLVGPASSGKTTILNAFGSCRTQTIHRSSLTKTALISGKISEEGSDPSILPKLKNRSLIIKDLTMLLTSNASAQEEVFGTLRDAYDQDLVVSYGNGAIRDYKDLNFSWLAGVTDIIHGFGKADVGERFLKIDIVDPDLDEFAMIEGAIKNQSTKRSADHFKAATKGFIDYLWKNESLSNPDNLPKIDDKQGRLITYVALVISCLRTKVKRSKDGTLDFRERKEFGIRVGMQLSKLAKFLCVVHQKDRLSDDELRDYILKVALDTCTSVQTEIVMKIMSYNRPVYVKELVEDMQVSKSTIEKHLRNLQESDILLMEKRSSDSGYGGNAYHVWNPTPTFKKLWLGAEFDKFQYSINTNLIRKIGDAMEDKEPKTKKLLVRRSR
jgi:predicted transcriptional regulator